MAISYLSLDSFIDSFFSPPLHFIKGYWRHVGLTWHICFIISCPGMIMVIDTVTSSPSSSVIGAYRSEIQEAAKRVGRGGGCRHSERYHGHLMDVNCRGTGMCVWLHVTNVALSTLCHVYERGGPDWLSVSLWTNNPPVTVITSTHPTRSSYHTWAGRKQ